jgi:hypothetical protein
MRNWNCLDQTWAPCMGGTSQRGSCLVPAPPIPNSHSAPLVAGIPGVAFQARQSDCYEGENCSRVPLLCRRQVRKVRGIPLHWAGKS